jgi:hypothetical protein
MAERRNVAAWCEDHDKALFLDRKAAKRHRRLYADRKGVREYRCDAHPGLWHLGHLPLVVVAGLKTVAEVYRGVG